MKTSSSWKLCALGVLASVGVMASPPPATAGNDSGLQVCFISVMSGQTAVRVTQAQAQPRAIPTRPTRPDGFPAPDLNLSALPAASLAR